MRLTHPVDTGILGGDSLPPETVEKTKAPTGPARRVETFTRLVEQPRERIADKHRDFCGDQRHQNLDCDCLDRFPGSPFPGTFSTRTSSTWVRHKPLPPQSVSYNARGVHAHLAVKAIHREEVPDNSSNMSISTLTRTERLGILGGDSLPPRLSDGEALAETANQGEGFVRLAEQISNRLDDQSCDYVSCQPPQEPPHGVATPPAVPFISAYATIMGHSSHLLPNSRRRYPHRARASARWWRHAHHQEEPGNPGTGEYNERQVTP